jgi:FtsZ-interacting cell division protein ZipA
MDTVIIIVALVVIVFCLVAIGVARSRSDRNSKFQVAAAREAYARDVESDRGDT